MFRGYHIFLSSTEVTEAQHLVVLVAPFMRPANGVGDTPPLPYYLYVACHVFFEDAR